MLNVTRLIVIVILNEVWCDVAHKILDIVRHYQQAEDIAYSRLVSIRNRLKDIAVERIEWFVRFVAVRSCRQAENDVEAAVRQQSCLTQM